MAGSGIEGLKKKALARVPKTARIVYDMGGIVWSCDYTPTVGDIIKTLTELINDLDPVAGIIEASTGRLIAIYRDENGVQSIEFGMQYLDRVSKVK